MSSKTTRCRASAERVGRSRVGHGAGGYLLRVLPFAQIVLGGLIAEVFSHNVALNPEIFFLLFLPPLLFLDGWRIPTGDALRDKAAILEFALGLVVFTKIGARQTPDDSR
jgi:monovalent cation/hydrogen antiporter